MNEIDKIYAMWRENNSVYLKENKSFPAVKELNRIAELFAPARFYYMIMNFFKMEFEYVYPGVEDILGYSQSEFQLNTILKSMSPEGLSSFQKREAKAGEFLFNFVDPLYLPYYKVSYFMKLKGKDGHTRKILHQSTTLTVGEENKILQTLVVHYDVSHLSIVDESKVSFIALKEGLKSYYNVDPEKDGFDQEGQNHDHKLNQVLTRREKEILQLIANGFSTINIASSLHISEYTVSKHRQNMLEKSGCQNTAELVSKALQEGLIR